jgi:hypothetical protein
MSLLQTRAQTRAHLIALSPKSSRKPKGARSAKAQSNRIHFAAAAVLGVALVLLVLSLSPFGSRHRACHWCRAF